MVESYNGFRIDFKGIFADWSAEKIICPAFPDVDYCRPLCEQVEQFPQHSSRKVISGGDVITPLSWIACLSGEVKNSTKASLEGAVPIT